ncbi:hypothetical protein FHG87_019166 [Trinorchestia longiramus]|nr:hypothetical protein FHG87_019166 [Trinorchestia longiramus]
MMGVLMRLQGAFAKFPCRLCFCDSRDTVVYHHKWEWQQRAEFSVWNNIVNWEPLMEPRKVLFPPLHFKLSILKQFVRAPDKESAAFGYLQDFFRKLFAVKEGANVFDRTEKGHRMQRVSPRISPVGRKLHRTVLSHWFCLFVES